MKRLHLALSKAAALLLFTNFCACSTSSSITSSITSMSTSTSTTSTTNLNQPTDPKTLLAGEDVGTKSHTVELIEGYGSFNQLHTATNQVNYEPLKLVFIRTEEDANSKDGPYLTYLELLQKADELGGHDIINVRIERTQNCTKTKKKEPECHNVRFGSALAIRYTSPVTLEDLTKLEVQKLKASQPTVVHKETPAPKDDKK